MPQTPDPVADYLQRAPMPAPWRADLWDAYHEATDADDLAVRFQAMPKLPQTIKAHLWDMKEAEMNPAPAVTRGPWWNPIEVPQGRDPELDRPDNSVLGVPPEMAVLSGLSVARAGMAPVAGAAQRVAEVAKATAREAVPYAGAAALNAVLPPSLAVPLSVALGIRAGRSGARPSAPRQTPTPRQPPMAAGWAARAQPSASPAAPVASTPGASVPRSQPGAAPAPSPAPQAGSPPPATPPAPSLRPHPQGGVWSPQRIQNELGLYSRRMKANLTEEEYRAATKLVEAGMPPPAAVAKTVASRPPAPAPKMTLNAAEGREFGKLRNQGKTPEEAYRIIEQQRELAARLGTPSSESVRKAVADRNNTGRWTPPTGYPK